MKKILFLAVSLILVLSFALTACNSSDSSGGKKGKAQSTLVFGRGADTTSLDPAVVTDGESFKVTKNIYDTLIEFKDGSVELQPGLATKWEVSDDGKTYTFHLRKGVKFQDGTDFNAKAVVFNFNRWKNGDAGKFAYYASMFGGTGDKSVIKSVTAVDDNTVKFELKHPSAPFLKDLAMSPFAIASPKAVKDAGDKYGVTTAVGTGPFKFEGDWKKNNTITIVKNDDYWKDGKPKLDRVIFKVIEDNTARLNALKNGEIDLMDGLNPNDVESLKNNKDLQVFNRPPMNVGYLGFNTENEILKNKKVRQALNHAVDKEALIKAFYAGQAEPAKNPMPPTISGYNDDIKPYDFDLDKAKELLKEAGYPDGFKIDLWAMPNPRPYMPAPQKIAENIKHNFAKIGVDANIVSYDWATYIQKTQNGDAPMFLLGWTGDNGDADNFLYTLLDKDTIGSNNYSRYSNDELHKLLTKAQTETDEEKRNELYKKAQVIIHEDAPWVPLVHSKPALAGSAKIEGFNPHPTGSDRLENVYFKK